MRLEISTSCSRVSSGTWPICFRYIRTGSSRISSRALSSSSSASGLLDAVHLGLVHDLDLRGRAAWYKSRPALPASTRFPAGLVDVVVGQVALFLRQPDEFLDFFRELRGGTVWQNGGGLLGVERPTSAPLRFPFFGDESGPVLRTFVLDIRLHTYTSDSQKRKRTRIW